MVLVNLSSLCLLNKCFYVSIILFGCYECNSTISLILQILCFHISLIISPKGSVQNSGNLFFTLRAEMRAFVPFSVSNRETILYY